MFCINCGNTIQDGHQFCTKCGQPSIRKETKEPSQQLNTMSSEKWWQRFLKVVYIFMYIPLLLIVPLVWNENSSSYSYYAGQSHYVDTYGEAFWYSLLTLVIYLVIVRLIKIAVLYITMGRRPEWKKEMRKLF